MLGDMGFYWLSLDGAYDGHTQMWKKNYGLFVLFSFWLYYQTCKILFPNQD